MPNLCHLSTKGINYYVSVNQWQLINYWMFPDNVALWQWGCKCITITGTWIDVYSGILRRMYPWTTGWQTVLTGVSHSSRLSWPTLLYYMSLITTHPEEILHFITILPFGYKDIWKRIWGFFGNVLLNIGFLLHQAVCLFILFICLFI